MWLIDADDSTKTPPLCVLLLASTADLTGCGNGDRACLSRCGLRYILTAFAWSRA